MLPFFENVVFDDVISMSAFSST